MMDKIICSCCQNKAKYEINSGQYVCGHHLAVMVDMSAEYGDVTVSVIERE